MYVLYDLFNITHPMIFRVLTVLALCGANFLIGTGIDHEVSSLLLATWQLSTPPSCLTSLKKAQKYYLIGCLNCMQIPHVASR